MLPLFLLTIENDDDKEFIRDLYENYYPIMKKKAYEMTNDYSVVGDLINDAFIKLINKVEVLRSLECGSRTSYIVYTVRNVCIDYIRKQARQSEHMFLGISDDLTDSISDAKAAVEEICSTKEDYEELGKALYQLSERDKNLLYYKYNLELKDKEIADIMDISENNIRQYLTRARRRAYKILTDKGGM